MSLFIFVVVCILVYFAPTLIAAARNKRNTCAIFILNAFLGWTLLGWLFALIWSFMYEEPIVSYA